ncbi:Ig-like domain (group 2) [Paenibacillus sp. 1_12]|uniref:Ig-like domain-containing protein n=1 Tax=Paenibacillus sp. 1_12 TaxID=1566278 RepID=UPI0008E54C57|nr:Ig-like domain-containing protein [Paenibacillus sp. 1_12]SFL97627.1 Ig-like domain (group 2) [Paenibacillus sp. 1_12]
MMVRMARVLSLLLVLMVAASNWSGARVLAADDIASLVVSKNELTLEVGSTSNITATAVFTSGTTENVTVKTDWNSGSTDVATVYAGAISAKKEGSATVTATYMGKTVIIHVTVTKKVKSLTKDKQLINLRLNQSDNVQITAYYDDGTFADVTSKADWSSDNNSIATVTNGEVKGLSSGKATITAKYNSLTLSLPVNVEIVQRIDPDKSQVSLLLKGTEKIKLMATYPDGTQVDVADKAEWETDKDTVADVLKGTITGYGPGQATIKATYGTKSTTIKVDVDNAIKLDFVEQTHLMKKNGTLQLTLNATYANGNTENITDRAEWSSSDDSIVYALKGKLTANAIGEVTITAKYGEKQITRTIYVDVPRRLEVDEETISLKSGTNTQIILYATYADSTAPREAVTDRAEWTVDNSSAIDVVKGKITAYKSGEALVTATYGGKTVQIKVLVDIPSFVTANKKTLNLAVGSYEQITLEASYANDATRKDTVTNAAEWKSSAPEVVDVSSGLITGLATGSSVVTAKYGTRTVTIQVTVGVLESLTTESTELVLKKGDVSNIAVKAKYKDGTVKEAAPEAVWTSSNLKAVTVDQGKVTAVGSGESTITATLDNKTVSIKVSVDTADDLTASSTYLVFDLGEIKQIVLTATDPLNVTKNVEAEAEWKTSNAQIVQVSKGTITPIARGKATITASYGGKSVTISVEIGVVQSLEVDQRFISMKTGNSVSVKLTATLSDGSKRDVTSAATWKTSAYKVADVSAGTITAIGSGKASVTGTFGGKAIALPIDVNTLKYLKTDVVKVDLTEGQEAQVTATGTYSDGSDEDVTIPALWTSANSMIADVKDGIIKATGKGKTRVTVTYSNIRWYVQVTVK